MDRIKELRRVKASELAPNPKNWRTHPVAQLQAIKATLEEIGWAGALLARETPDGLELIDGHARAELDPDQEVPVLILDVNEQEADKLLATYDPIAAMATADNEKLDELIGTISTQNAALQALLNNLSYGDEANDPDEEWKGMPSFDHEDKTSYQSIHVHFADAEAVEQFAKLIGKKLTDKTRSIWYPDAEIERALDKHYG